MILEAIVTTRNADGTINIAPMGPSCPDPSFQQFELRPFCSSNTWNNLQRTGQGVLHVTDDVLVFARSATRADWQAKLEPASQVDCEWLGDCCRCYEFETTWMDDTQPRAVVHCKTLSAHRFRDFLGFNRAKHAVIEASILATRIDFLPPTQIQNQLLDLQKMVSKTGGEQERIAFELLEKFFVENGVIPTQGSAQ